MKDRSWLKTALYPLSAAYGLITNARNLLYDQGVFSSGKATQTVISIGNLTVGGTGKSPMIEYLARKMIKSVPVAILSRGYGRKTSGFLLADHTATASTIGDEPLQFYIKFHTEIPVAVCENRLAGAETLARLKPECKVLLLDDAYQHRAIRRDINLLLSDFNRPFYEDEPFPGGRLRENRKGADRADAVIVTKCPDDLSPALRKDIMTHIEKYTRPGTPVFFAHIAYGQPLDFSGSPVALKNVKIVTGIADPGPFSGYVRGMFNVVSEAIFPDHYNYQHTDVESLIKNLKNDTFALTTEKDMVKLKPVTEQAGCSGRFAYIPVATDFGADTARFDSWLDKRLAQLPGVAE